MKSNAFLPIKMKAMLLPIALIIATNLVYAEDNMNWDKTFKLSNKVTHEKVSYPNRYGITLSADMYLPKDMDKSRKYPTLVIGTPYGGVKEQGAGIYAQNMAERGFVAIAFDESFNGESGGGPRHISSPEIFSEDFSAGVDFLGTRPFVDRNKIGAIGICGSGAFSLKAAQVDHRIKAIATASMYDMSRVIRNGWQDGMSAKERNKMLDELGEQRWKDFENGAPMLPEGFPSKPTASIPEGLDPISSEFWEYYAMERGHHPRSRGPFSVTSNMAFMNFPLMNFVEDISPRPILFIMGENAHSRYFTEDAYKLAAEPKELVIVPGARHIDLYDRVDLIPFDKMEEFFTKALNAERPLAAVQAEQTASMGVFPRGDLNEAYAKYFTGTSYLKMLTTEGVGIGNVTFEPGCRNFWHIHHKGGQILLVTSGRGWYQEEGKPARAIVAGDVVNIPAGTKHWHGAAKDSWMTHLSVAVPAEGGSTEWFEAVSAAQYDAAK